MSSELDLAPSLCFLTLPQHKLTDRMFCFAVDERSCQLKLLRLNTDINISPFGMDLLRCFNTETDSAN